MDKITEIIRLQNLLKELRRSDYTKLNLRKLEELRQEVAYRIDVITHEEASSTVTAGVKA